MPQPPAERGGHTPTPPASAGHAARPRSACSEPGSLPRARACPSTPVTLCAPQTKGPHLNPPPGAGPPAQRVSDCGDSGGRGSARTCLAGGRPLPLQGQGRMGDQARAPSAVRGRRPGRLPGLSLRTASTEAGSPASAAAAPRAARTVHGAGGSAPLGAQAAATRWGHFLPVFFCLNPQTQERHKNLPHGHCFTKQNPRHEDVNVSHACVTSNPELRTVTGQ